MDVKKIEEKYASLPYPVVVSGTDGIIVFANDTAKKTFKSVKKNSSIAVMIEASELAALNETVSAGEICAINVKLPAKSGISEQAGGLAVPESIGGADYITYFFIPPFALTGGISDYKLAIRQILAVYNKEKSFRISDTLFSGKEADLKDIYESYKKIAKIDKYIHFCMQSLLENENSNAAVQIREITSDLTLLKESFDRYIGAQGYRIRYLFEDNLFYFEYNEWDFLVVNAIGVSFALRNSADKRIDYTFKTDRTGAANIEIAFTPPEKIFDYFTKDKSMNIAETGNIDSQKGADFNYFDLYLAHTVAANNKINFYLSSEDKKIKFILEIKKPQNLSSGDMTACRAVSAREKYGKPLEQFLMVDFFGE